MTETRPIKSHLRRKFLGVPLIGWALLVMSGTAIAAAVFWVTLDATGTFSVSGDTIDDGALTFVAGSEYSEGPCSIAVIDPTTIDIQATGLAPNDQCVLEVNVANADASAAALQGFSLSESFPQDGSVPGPMLGWDHDVNGVPQSGYCGTEIPGGSPGTTIGMVIHVDAVTVVPGESYSLVAGDGFNFVPFAQYNGSQCG